jgi:CRISPR-associated protein Cmr5
MQTLQQLRAAHALAQVTKWKGAGKDSKLKARASELPFMIHASGLGQAAAFFKSKGAKDGYDKVFDALQSWLSQKQRPFAGRVDLMQAITGADMRQYRMAQAEAMAYMEWVKQFAAAYLASEDAGKEPQP